MSVAVSAEEAAYWYFRLNGCFRIKNFILHPDPDCDPSHNQARSDADLIGVLFPWRSELQMIDDQYLVHDQGDRILVLFAE